MSVEQTTAAREPDPFRRGHWSPLVRWRLLPRWTRVLLVYAAARAITTVMVLQLAREQPPNGWTGGQPGYFEYANLWDARWYAFIAAAGYPTELPRTEDGHVAGRGRAGTVVVAATNQPGAGARRSEPGGSGRRVVGAEPGLDVFDSLRAAPARIDLTPGVPDLAAFPRAAPGRQPAGWPASA